MNIWDWEVESDIKFRLSALARESVIVWVAEEESRVHFETPREAEKGVRVGSGGKLRCG
jgi:hypothetical protein